MFGPACLSAMQDHARNEYPRESCGLVVNGNYVACRNVNENPDEEFKFEDREWARWRSTNNVQAVIHSHPDGVKHPSFADQIGQMAMPRIPWGIVWLDKFRINPAFFWGESLPIPPLEGRTWLMGVRDCYGLVRDYFKITLDIELPNRPRKTEWWLDPKERDLLVRNYHGDGWEDVADWKTTIQLHDVFLVRFDGFSVPTHCAVYIGQGKALHHRWDRPSTVVPVAAYTPLIERVVRYKGLARA